MTNFSRPGTSERQICYSFCSMFESSVLFSDKKCFEIGHYFLKSPLREDFGLILSCSNHMFYISNKA